MAAGATIMQLPADWSVVRATAGATVVETLVSRGRVVEMLSELEAIGHLLVVFQVRAAVLASAEHAALVEAGNILEAVLISFSLGHEVMVQSSLSFVDRGPGRPRLNLKVGFSEGQLAQEGAEKRVFRPSDPLPSLVEEIGVLWNGHGAAAPLTQNLPS